MNSQPQGYGAATRKDVERSAGASASEPKALRLPCRECGGRGVIDVGGYLGFGPTCTSCDGEGQFAVCVECGGDAELRRGEPIFPTGSTLNNAAPAAMCRECAIDSISL